MDMQHSLPSLDDDSTCGHVLFLGKDPILGIDLTAALSAQGPILLTRMTAADGALLSADFCAVILDIEHWDQKVVDLVRLNVPTKTPVMVISDSFEFAQTFGVDEGSWFTKPVSADQLATRISDLMRISDRTRLAS